MKPNIAWAVVGAVALDATAQTTTAHPADATAAVPPAVYRSAFQDYVPYREQKLAPWRTLNDDVARIGGHLGIFRGSGAMPNAQPQAPSASAAGSEDATRQRSPAGSAATTQPATPR